MGLSTHNMTINLISQQAFKPNLPFIPKKLIHIITENTSHISSSLHGLLELIQTIQVKPTQTSNLLQETNVPKCKTTTYIDNSTNKTITRKNKPFAPKNVTRGEVPVMVYKDIHSTKKTTKMVNG
jgi:hypothetical protein